MKFTQIILVLRLVLFLWASISPLIASAECIGDQSAKKIYTVYIVPQLTASEIFVNWSPLLKKLGEQSQKCFALIVPASIPQFEKELLSGKPDFAFANPYHAVMAFQSHQYIPLVADGKTQLNGLILVKANSKIKNLKELNNSEIAFPAPNSFGASLLTRMLLTQENVSFSANYVVSHKNVYRAVIAGDAIAGGGVNATFMREPEEIQSQLRVLRSTSSYRPHPFIANPNVPLEDRKLIQACFINLKSDKVNEKLLNDIEIPDPIAVNYANDYALIEKINLKKYVNPTRY
jgi:phosphonate transport system substrate-binding protein